MNELLLNPLVVNSSIPLIILNLPSERPDSFSDCSIENTVGEPAYNPLCDDLQIDIYKN